jgi:transposase
MITALRRDEQVIAGHLYLPALTLQGQVTNMLPQQASWEQAAQHYRQGWCLERDFHLLKDCPLGIRSLCVGHYDQIVGLTHLLTLT